MQWNINIDNTMACNGIQLNTVSVDNTMKCNEIQQNANVENTSEHKRSDNVEYKRRLHIGIQTYRQHHGIQT